MMTVEEGKLHRRAQGKKNEDIEFATEITICIVAIRLDANAHRVWRLGELSCCIAEDSVEQTPGECPNGDGPRG